jgi:competence protein ComEC
MWRSSRTFGSPTAEPPGSRLVTLAVAVIAAALVGNLSPPDPRFGLPLAVLVLLTGWRGLRGAGARLGWWAACGVLLGLAACAFAPRSAAGDTGNPVPVRFVISVRDGWRSGILGWGTRVRVDALERAGAPLRHTRELQLYVTSPVGLARLPEPGTCWEGSGELVPRPKFGLAPGYLRVKTVLLLRPCSGGSVVDRVREGGLQALQASAGVDPRRLHAAGLAAALVLQRRESLQAGELASMRRAGLVHLLSVSGLHVGLVAILVWGGLNLGGVRPSTRRWVVMVALLIFALLAGGNAPVRRAAAAGIAYLAARQFGRPLEPLPTVWAIVAGLVVIEPAVLLQPGFELSAFVTLALVRWVTPVAGLLTVLPHRLAQVLSVALVAQAASAPLVGGHFAVVPPLGVLANLLATPLELILVAGSLLALGVAPLWGWLGGIVLSGVAVGQWLLDGASDVGGLWSAQFPPAGLPLALLFAILGVAAMTRVRFAAHAALLVVGFTVAWMLVPAWPSGFRHRVRLLDVHEGMAVLVQSGEAALLVDAGRSPIDAWRELARARVRRLDGVMLTHPDADHIGGVAMLLERLPVKRLFFPQAFGGRPEIVALCRAARVAGVHEIALVQGQRFFAGRITGEVLWPPRRLEGRDNDASLVARLEVGGVTVLVTGDLEAPGERSLLAGGQNLTADVLQLPHHGSRTSSTAAFLGVVHPVIALAATGVHPRFAYPDPTVVARTERIPAVLVDQRWGPMSVGWRDAGPLTVATFEPVTVSRQRRARSE